MSSTVTLEKKEKDSTDLHLSVLDNLRMIRTGHRVEGIEMG